MDDLSPRADPRQGGCRVGAPKSRPRSAAVDCDTSPKTTAPLKTTYAESLALELSSGVRHEFVDGFAYAMAGGEPEHARLALSIGAELRQLLRGGPCRVFSSDLKVRVPASGNACYADVAAVCGPLARDAADPLAVTNPTMLVEVLSPSTELFDRGIGNPTGPTRVGRKPVPAYGGVQRAVIARHPAETPMPVVPPK